MESHGCCWPGIFCFIAVEDSATLLSKLVEVEGRKGHAIALPGGLQDRAQPVRTQRVE